MFTMPKFPDAFEEATFWERRDTYNRTMRRIQMTFGVVALWSFVVMDFLIGDVQAMLLILTRTGVVLAMLLALVAFCWAQTPTQRDGAIFTYGIIAIIGEIAFCAIAPPESAHFYQFGLGVVIGFGAILVVPRFRVITAMYVVTIVTYAAFIPLFSGTALEITIHALFVFIIATAILIGSFERERLERMEALALIRMKKANAESSAARVEAIHARDAAVEASRSKNQFVASISHELRTPLNAIIGFSDMMKSELFGSIEQRQYREYVDHINSSGHLLLTNISDLMDLARLESGKLGWRDEHFAVQDMMSDALTTCAVNAEQAGIALTLLPNDTNMVVAHADPMRIRQAVINLTTNAIKFTPGGNEVTLSSTIREDGSLALTVADTGCGMSAEALEQVREPFAQGHEDSERKGGLGLGLAIVCGILDHVGGRLEIDSEIDVGTTATLVIPRDRITRTGTTVDFAAA